ncbi:BMP family ABC transporter substrate-binding protein [Clostridium sp. KNHs214]|uniref:BMP family lipoprotein n=1 Tax=Clostridium sp. KNHs214 TaxID=1540257 RepID=UPI000553EA44|nr:BMP family ABC transporter substrate-binding protein [Clostridium sp. KNHs214]
MNKKRIVAMLASLAMVASLFVGCGKAENENATSGAKEGQKQEQKGKDIKIGLSTDEGGLNDKSFNQSADKGIKDAQKATGVQYFPIESKQKEDYEQNLQTLSLDQNCDLTFAIGYQMQEALEKIAKANSDKKYAIVDSVIEAPNVRSLMFKEEEGSFLVGVIAAKTTKTGKIGYIGGKDVPSINKFTAGYIAGARAVNPNIKVVVKYADSFSDTNKGYEFGKSLYNEGCDVVYHAAGGVGIGLFKAADEIKKAGKSVWAIGVDQDQAVTVSEYKNVILTSMIKRVDIATKESVESIVNGTFKGETKVYGLKENGVGVADTSKANVPADVLELVEKYKKSIVDGKIKVPETKEKAMKFTTDAVK